MILQEAIVCILFVVALVYIFNHMKKQIYSKASNKTCSGCSKRIIMDKK